MSLDIGDKISDVITVSIIIPVYNVENYLEQCLSSVVKQTFKNTEIILLNDGSTDGSLRICRKYEKMDGRVIVCSHENRGLGETRNRGIAMAKGEYLFFADSDDYLGKDYVESLYKKAVKTGADVVQGESIMIFEGDGTEKLEVDLSGYDDVEIDPSNSDSFFRDIFFTHVYKHYAWNKLYRASFVKEHGILFGDNKRIFAEDTWFQLQLFHYHPHIAFDSGSYYYYRQRATSIMHTPKQNLLQRQAAMVDDYASLLKSHNGTELETKICGMISMDVFTMEALNQIDTNGSLKSYRKAINNLRNYPAIYDNVCGFNRSKAYTLEVKSFRKKYVRIISMLYQCKLDVLAQFVVWWTYKITRG